MSYYVLHIRRPTRSIRTATLLPYTTRCRSGRRAALRQMGRDHTTGSHLAPALADRDGAHPQRHLGAADRHRLPEHRRREFPHRASRYCGREPDRSEENTSEPQTLMRLSHAAFCLIKKTNRSITHKLAM